MVGGRGPRFGMGVEIGGQKKGKQPNKETKANPVTMITVTVFGEYLLGVRYGLGHL